MPTRPLVLAASGTLFAYFVIDYASARGLYAVVAGMHAWLEWPLVLLAAARALGPQDRAKDAVAPAG